MFRINNKDTNGVVLVLTIVNFEYISHLVLVFLLLIAKLKNRLKITFLKKS